MNEPRHPSWSGEPGAVDLDVVDDPHASAQDRALDARLARLVTDQLLALELPPARIDLGDVKRRATARRARRRRRAGWVVGAVGSAAAAVAVAVAAAGTGLLPRPGPFDRAPTTSSRGDAGPVPLRVGVPDLPADEVTRLEALQEPGLLRDRVPVPFRYFTTAVDCDRTELDLGVRPAELDGIDTSGMHQVCAVTDDGTSAGADGEPEHDRYLYRFYLPPGTELGDAAAETAAGAGISWTEVAVDRRPEPVVADDRPHAQGGGVTTVTWGAWEPALASVRRTGSSSTEVTWVEPHARSDAGGDHSAGVRAVVAAAPVTAVRAARGFVNQGGRQVLRGDDGTLLLVPTSPPGFSMQALGGGRLTRTPEGCLGVADGSGQFQLVLWPYGTTWDPASQTLTVPGVGEVRLGQDFRMGGGEGDSLAPLQLVPAACATEKTWISGSF